MKKYIFKNWLIICTCRIIYICILPICIYLFFSIQINCGHTEFIDRRSRIDQPSVSQSVNRLSFILIVFCTCEFYVLALFNIKMAHINKLTVQILKNSNVEAILGNIVMRTNRYVCTLPVSCIHRFMFMLNWPADVLQCLFFFFKIIILILSK